jgi:hypothetical protein
LLSMGLKTFNTKVTDRLQQLTATTRPSMHLALLPKLTSVLQSEALTWADDEDIRRHCKRSLEPEIRRLYEGWGAREGMPMEDLADRLNEILQRHSRRGKDDDRTL